MPKVPAGLPTLPCSTASPAEKLEREAESVRAQGWKWVEIMPDVAWDTLRSFDRIYPTPTEQQQAQIDKLQAERDKIDEDEDGEKVEQLSAKFEKLESENSLLQREDKAISGVIVTIDHEGELDIIDGLVRQEDRAAAKKKKAEANGEDGNTPPCFSSKLIEDLTAHRTAALQAMLADNPKVALAAVVHAMALGVFYDERDASRLQITPRVVYLDRHAEGMDGTEAAKQLAATTKAMRKRLPKQASKLWAWLQNQQQKTLLALLAVCAGHTVDAVAKNGGDSGEHGRAACRRAQARHGGLLAADRSRVFQPRVERADARRHRGRVRCQRQGRLCHAQENGAGRGGGGEAEGLALAARTPAGGISAGATGSGTSRRSRCSRGDGGRREAATAPRSCGALRLSWPALMRAAFAFISTRDTTHFLNQVRSSPAAIRGGTPSLSNE